MSFKRARAYTSRAAILVIAVALMTGCKEEILHGLSEREANRLVARLYSEKVEASKTKQADGLWTLSVESADSVKAISLLESRRLMTGAALLETSSRGVLQSREESRMVYERNLSANIEMSIATLPGVLEARVHLNLQPLDPLLGLPIKGSVGSASILVVHQVGYAVNPVDLARLVSGASGIAEEQVKVLLTPANESFERNGVLANAVVGQSKERAESGSTTAASLSSILNGSGGQIGLSLVLVIAGFFLIFKKKPNRKLPSAGLSVPTNSLV